jgi:hypothetical protein
LIVILIYLKIYMGSRDPCYHGEFLDSPRKDGVVQIAGVCHVRRGRTDSLS